MSEDSEGLRESGTHSSFLSLRLVSRALFNLAHSPTAISSSSSTIHELKVFIQVAFAQTHTHWHVHLFDKLLKRHIDAKDENEELLCLVGRIDRAGAMGVLPGSTSS